MALTPMTSRIRWGVLHPAGTQSLVQGGRPVADLVFVGLTVVLFAALAALIRAVERR